jgi:hypothetical protein
MAGRPAVDVLSFAKGIFNLPPISANAWDYRMNLDGYVSYSRMGTECSTSYAQVFPNGIIEAVRVVSLSSGTEHLALSDKFTEPVVRAAEAYMDLYQRLEIEPPFTLMFALLGVKGFSIRAEGMFPDECCAFDRDELLFPETIVDDLGQPAESWLGPLFDMVWQASGFLCMPRRA